MPSPQQIPHILVIDNYAPNHPDYERLAQTTGIVFRKPFKNVSQNSAKNFSPRRSNYLPEGRRTFTREAQRASFQTEMGPHYRKWFPFTIDDQDEWITNQIHVYQQNLNKEFMLLFWEFVLDTNSWQ